MTGRPSPPARVPRSTWCAERSADLTKCSRRPASRPSAARRWRTCSMAKNEGKGGTVKERLVKGLRGSQAKHRLSVKALGLNKLNDVRELKDSPQDRGLITKGNSLVRAEAYDMRMNPLSPATSARNEHH